jgi:hypothetical protein
MAETHYIHTFESDEELYAGISYELSIQTIDNELVIAGAKHGLFGLTERIPISLEGSRLSYLLKALVHDEPFYIGPDSYGKNVVSSLMVDPYELNFVLSARGLIHEVKEFDFEFDDEIKADLIETLQYLYSLKRQ